MSLWMLLLLACTSDQGLEEVPEPVGPTPITYQLVPATVSFGEPALGDSVSKLLEVYNRGEEEFFLEDVLLPEHLEVVVSTMPVILPGASTSVLLTWTPDDMSLLSEEIQLVIGDGAQSETATVPVTGGARGGFLTASTVEYDFGDLAIGCQKDFAVTYTNTGNEALTVDELSVSGSADFEMSGLELPMTLGPFESEQLEVVFKPSLPQEVGSMVELQGEDAYAFSSLRGNGTADGENEMVWTTKESGGKMTVIFHVHGWFIPGNWSEGYGHGMWTTYFEENLDHFFEVLQDSGANYRVAFIWNVDGKVRGTEDYLDRSFSPSESREIALEEMLDGGESTDIDQTWPLYIAAVEENEDWLFENETWTDSKLSFVVITRDQEQSGMLWSTAMTTLQASKEDEDTVTFSAISGPPPMGCDGGVVEYPRNMYEAINASGGLILSACETDWTSNWEKLAAHTMNGSAYFSLEGTVLVSSIKVFVDGQRMTNGWTWDPAFNAVIFDDGYYPLAGSTVRITYLLGGECEED